MEQIQKVEEAFHFEEREDQTWFLVRHNYLPFILSGTYVSIATVFGPALMRNRKPFDLRRTLVAFNFLVVFVYLVSLVTYTWSTFMMGSEIFCKGGEVRKGQPVYMAMRSLWVIYMLKYVELLDTMFYILRKKHHMVSFLHVFHHALVPLIGWLMFKLRFSTFQSFPAVINAAVHVIMYSYYALGAMGPKYKKYIWWKKYLIQLQIIHIVFIIVFQCVVTPLSGCAEIRGMSKYTIILGCIFLCLFCQFYLRSFKSETSQVRKSEEKETSDHTKLK